MAGGSTGSSFTPLDWRVRAEIGAPARLEIRSAEKPPAVLSYLEKRWLLLEWTGTTGDYRATYTEYYPERPSPSSEVFSSSGDVAAFISSLNLFNSVIDEVSLQFSSEHSIQRGDLVLTTIARILLSENLYFFIAEENGQTVFRIRQLGVPTITDCRELAENGSISGITELVCIPSGEMSEIVQPVVVSDPDLESQYGRRVGWTFIDIGPCVRNWDCPLDSWLENRCRDEFDRRKEVAVSGHLSICPGSEVWPGFGINSAWAPRVEIGPEGSRVEFRMPSRRAMNVPRGIADSVLVTKTAAVDTIQASEGDNANPDNPLDIYMFVPKGYKPRKLRVLYSVEPFRAYLPKHDPSASSFQFKKMAIRDDAPHVDQDATELTYDYEIPDYWPVPNVYGRIVVYAADNAVQTLTISHVDSSTGTETELLSVQITDGSDVPVTRVVEFTTVPPDDTSPELSFPGNKLRVRLTADSEVRLWFRADTIMPAEPIPVAETGIHSAETNAVIDEIEVSYWPGESPDFGSTPAVQVTSNPSTAKGVAVFDFSSTSFQTPGWMRIRLRPTANAYVKSTSSLLCFAVPK